MDTIQYRAVTREAKSVTWAEVPDSLETSSHSTLRGDRINIIDSYVDPGRRRAVYVQYFQLPSEGDEYAYRVVFEGTSLPQEDWRVGTSEVVLETARSLRKLMEEQWFEQQRLLNPNSGESSKLLQALTSLIQCSHTCEHCQDAAKLVNEVAVSMGAKTSLEGDER